jgi:DNA-nicking Smr family endonuclease
MGKRRTAKPKAAAPQTLHGAVVADELDLHGFALEAAEHRLEAFLETHAVRTPGGVVRVITGKGKGAGSRPVLQDAVREALDGWLARHVSDWSVDMGGGAYLVRLRG